MANEKNLKPWKPGQSGNPNGGSTASVEMRVIRRMTYAEVEDIGQMLLENNTAQLEEVANDRDAPVLRRYLGKVILRGMNKGDGMALNAILDRIVGKVPDRSISHHTHTIEIPDHLRQMSDIELMKYTKAKIEEELKRLELPGPDIG